MKNIYLQLAEYDTTVKGLVLATVVAASGSTPQKPGSSALFLNGRLIAGTVGGGIVENKISIYAARCVEARESALLRFNLDNDTDAPEEAVCGGMLSILVDSDPLRSHDVFLKMAESLCEVRPGVLVTRVVPWNDSTVLVSRCWATKECDPHVPGNDDDRIAEEVQQMLSAGTRSGYRQLEMEIPGEAKHATVCLEPVFPPQRLIIAGAGHVGKAVSHQGRLLGFEVTVIDDRAEYANRNNLPDADNIIVRDIGEAMRELQMIPDTYIVIVTRGHSHDAEALRPCIGSEASYVGMMGSRIKVAKMHEEFITNGWATEEQWKKICTPVGIDIGSQTVEEIAVSIAAQLIVYRGNRGPIRQLAEKEPVFREGREGKKGNNI